MCALVCAEVGGPARVRFVRFYSWNSLVALPTHTPPTQISESKPRAISWRPTALAMSRSPHIRVCPSLLSFIQLGLWHPPVLGGQQSLVCVLES